MKAQRTSGSTVSLRRMVVAMLVIVLGLPTAGLAYARPADAAEPVAAAISGRVSSEGSGDGLSVVAFTRVEDGHGARWDIARMTNTDSTGGFLIEGLAAGAYKVGVFDWRPVRDLLDGYYGGPTLDSAYEIDVGEGETVEGVNVTLLMGGRIVGTVEGPDGPVEGVFVNVYGVTSDAAEYVWLEARVITGADGGFSVGGLRSGAYKVSFADYANGIYETTYGTGQPTLQEATSIVVAAGGDAVEVRGEVSRKGGQLARIAADCDTCETAGADRYETAVNVSKKTFPEGGRKAVVLATGRDYADALSASALAGAANAPILLVDGKAKSLSAAVRAEIERLTAGSGAFNVYVMGGTLAVSRAVEDDLKAKLKGENVVRVSGDSRYGTAVEAARITRDLAGRPLRNALVVTGRDFADGLLAGPVAAGHVRPVLLTDNSRKVNEAVKSALAYIGATDADVIGDTKAVTDATVAALDTYLVGQAARVASAACAKDRSVEVARWGVRAGLLNIQTIGLASATRFADGLVASVRLGRGQNPVILVDGGPLSEMKNQALADARGTLTKVAIFGGTVAIPAEVRDEIMALVR